MCTGNTSKNDIEGNIEWLDELRQSIRYWRSVRQRFATARVVHGYNSINGHVDCR
jgi:hypothetical protein